jgi:hypothetical protein
MLFTLPFTAAATPSSTFNAALSGIAFAGSVTGFSTPGTATGRLLAAVSDAGIGNVNMDAAGSIWVSGVYSI